MAVLDGGFALGVDLGTSNTVAVLRWPDGRTRPLLFDGQPIMPSGVFLDTSGRLHVGRDAQRLAQADPARYEPNPKRRIDEPGVLLGDREVPTADLLAAVLRAVANAAVEAAGFLPSAVVTYPASWGSRRREVLANAVARAGWPPVSPAFVQGDAATRASAPASGTRLVPEPVAAARYFAESLRRPVPVGSAIVVFDFGGGTLDIAVVRNEGADQTGRARFSVIGSGGVSELGGLDLDAALVAHLGQLLGESDPQAWQELSQPTTASQWRNRRQFWDDVRGAKEMLSRSTVAPVPVPGVEQAVHLTREELERVTGPLLRRGVVEAGEVISRCGLTPEQLAGLFLVGGSSRVPLVARLLHAELGIAPTVLEQPELPVAEGALAELTAPPVHASGAVASPPGTVPPPPGMPVPPPPGMPAPLSPGRPSHAASHAPAAVPAQGGSPTWAAVPAQVAPGVVSHGGTAAAGTAVAGIAPSSAVPTSPGQPPVSPPSGSPGLVPGPRVPIGAGSPPASKPPISASSQDQRKVWTWVGAATALVAVVIAAVFYFRSAYDEIDFQPFEDVARIGAGESPTYAYTALIGDRAYMAFELEGERLEIVAYDTKKKSELWRKQTSVTSDRWAGITALPGAVVAFASEPSDSTPRKIVAFDAARGMERWQRDIHGNDAVLFFEDVAVHVDRTANRMTGFDLGTGNRKWDRALLTDANGDSRSAIYSVATYADLGGPADPFGVPAAPNRRDDDRLVEIGVNRTVRVIDSDTGDVLKERSNVADPDDLVTVYEGRLYVTRTEGGYQVAAYDLKTMGEPVSVYTAKDDKHRPEQLKPCGKDRICLLETANYDAKSTELIAVDAANGGQLWRKPAPEAKIIVPVGEHVLVRIESSKYVSTIFDSEGEEVLRRDGVAVRLNGGNVLLFPKELSTLMDDPAVEGFPVSADKPVQLGELKARPATCSWNTSLIVCAAESDFVVRRFAAS